MKAAILCGDMQDGRAHNFVTNYNGDDNSPDRFCTYCGALLKIEGDSSVIVRAQLHDAEEIADGTA